MRSKLAPIFPILLLFGLLTVAFLNPFGPQPKPRSDGVQSRENKGGHELWMYTDAKHWDEDGDAVKKAAEERTRKIAEQGRRVKEFNTDIWKPDVLLYLRRINLDYAD